MHHILRISLILCKITKYFVGGFEFRFTDSFVVIVLLDYLNTKKVFVGKGTRQEELREF